jgi:hypothetical protein
VGSTDLSSSLCSLPHSPIGRNINAVHTGGEILAFLGRYGVYIGIFVPTFPDNLSVAACWAAWPLKIRPTGCTKASVNNYQAKIPFTPRPKSEVTLVAGGVGVTGIRRFTYFSSSSSSPPPPPRPVSLISPVCTALLGLLCYPKCSIQPRFSNPLLRIKRQRSLTEAVLFFSCYRTSRIPVPGGAPCWASLVRSSQRQSSRHVGTPNHRNFGILLTWTSG